MQKVGVDTLLASGQIEVVAVQAQPVMGHVVSENRLASGSKPSMVGIDCSLHFESVSDISDLKCFVHADVDPRAATESTTKPHHC